METIYVTIKGEDFSAGDIEKGEFGGWCAVAYDVKDEENFEAFFRYKKDAIAWVKRKFKSQFN